MKLHAVVQLAGLLVGRCLLSQPVVTLFETGVPLFRAGLPPDLVATLTPGKTVTIDVGGRSSPATVARRRGDLDPATRTIPILFELPGADDLPEGKLGKLILTRRVRGAGTWLPRKALSEGPRGLWTVFLAINTPEGLVTGT